MTNYDLFNLAQSCPDVNITVKSGELLEMVEHCVRTTRKELEQLITDSNTEGYPSPSQVAKIFNVDRSTLFRWKKKGFLVPVEIGGKRRYKMSDIKRILEK